MDHMGTSTGCRADINSDLWRKISIYVAIPALLIASVNAWNLYSAHQAHLAEHAEHAAEDVRSILPSSKPSNGVH